MNLRRNFGRFSFVFQDRVSLCISGYPGTQSVDQAGLELTDIHLPLTSRVLGLKACSTSARLEILDF